MTQSPSPSADPKPFAAEWKRRVLRSILLGEPPPGCKGEMSMHRAILERAIHDYVKGRDWEPEDVDTLWTTDAGKEKVRDFRSARKWIFTTTRDDLIEAAVPFNAVCLLLGVDPREVRRLCGELSALEVRLWIDARSKFREAM